MNLVKVGFIDDRRREERRKKNTFFFYPERRTGFDRRKNISKTKAGYFYEKTVKFIKNNSHVMLAMLVILNFLNIADYFLTLNWLSFGVRELNPVLRWMFGLSVYHAGLFKISSILAVSLLVWYLRKYRRIIEFSIAAILLFMLVYIYHLLGAVLIII